jgi:hypothetical protein
MYLFSEMKGYEGGGKLSQNRQVELCCFKAPSSRQHEEVVSANQTRDIASNDTIVVVV